jgi:hypothetical protein
MVQCLKSTGSSNPLVLIDEIDKLGRGHTGEAGDTCLTLRRAQSVVHFQTPESHSNTPTKSHVACYSCCRQPCLCAARAA